jgi:hypothetical protein
MYSFRHASRDISLCNSVSASVTTTTTVNSSTVMFIILVGCSSVPQQHIGCIMTQQSSSWFDVGGSLLFGKTVPRQTVETPVKCIKRLLVNASPNNNTEPLSKSYQTASPIKLQSLRFDTFPKTPENFYAVLHLDRYLSVARFRPFPSGP